MIKYYVESYHPHEHVFNIKLVINRPDPNGQILSLPNWIPGSYLLREYARHIITLEAFSGRQNPKKIKIEKLKDNTWKCENSNAPLIVVYTVYAWDLTVEGAYLDQTRAFFNGCALLMMVHGQEMDRQGIKICAPKCPGAQLWQVATTLSRDKTPAWSYGWYFADSYDELIDHPVMMGNFSILSFSIKKIPHSIVILGNQDGDLDRLTKDIKKICNYHINFFDKKPPFNKYMFLVSVLRGDEGGGLEHRSSSALMVERHFFPVIGDSNLSQDYLYLLSLFSHEYFHTWNVKNIKPLSFMPYDLNEKIYTTQLWAFEGMTSYFGDLALVRCKVIPLKKYFELLAQNITKLLRTPGREKQTVADSSFDVWIKYNKPNENSLNSVVNYYIKGHIIGLLLDLALRLKTKGKYTLNHLMQILWLNFGFLKIGVPEGKIENIIAKLGGRTLEKLSFEALYTTKELPIKNILQKFGLQLILHSVLTKQELLNKGMNVQAHQKNSFKQGIFGFSTYTRFSRLYVLDVVVGSAACQAGVSANDEILAIDDLRVDDWSFLKIANRLKVGQVVSLLIARQEVIYPLILTLTVPPCDLAEIKMLKNITPIQKRNIKKWLS